MRATAAVPGSSAATNSRSVLITAGVATSLRAAADTRADAAALSSALLSQLRAQAACSARAAGTLNFRFQGS